MDFTNANLLSLNRNNKFFDSEFRFGTDFTCEIQGYFLDLQNDLGVTGLVDASETFRTGLKDYQPITINGNDFGKGRVLNFTTNEDVSLKYSTYNLTIEGYESGNLETLTGKYYNSIDFFNTGSGIIEAPNLLNSFSEDFSFDRGDNIFSFEHKLEFNYASGDGLTISPIERAKGMGAKIFNDPAPPFELTDSLSGINFFDGVLNETFEEVYDVINQSATFTRNVSTLNPINASNQYFVRRSHEFNKDKNGDVTVSENTTIKLNSPAIKSLKSALQDEINNSYNRCNNVYQTYVEVGSLKEKSTSLRRTINNFAKEATFVVVYSDSEINDNENYYFNLSHSISVNDNVTSVTESANIEGRGSSESLKLANAIAAYESQSPNARARSLNFYLNNGGPTDGSKFNLVSSKYSKDIKKAAISYSLAFSDDPKIVNGRRVNITTSNKIPTNKIATYSTIGQKDFVQEINTTNQGVVDLNIDIDGKEDDTLSTLLAEAKTIANSHIPAGNDVFINDCSYNFNLEEKKISVRVQYYYNLNIRSSKYL